MYGHDFDDSKGSYFPPSEGSIDNGYESHLWNGDHDPAPEPVFRILTREQQYHRYHREICESELRARGLVEIYCKRCRSLEYIAHHPFGNVGHRTTSNGCVITCAHGHETHVRGLIVANPKVADAAIINYAGIKGCIA